MAKEDVGEESIDDLIRKAPTTNELVPEWMLLDAEFYPRGDQLVKTIVGVEHRFIKVAKGIYQYYGQHVFKKPFTNQRPMGEYL